MQKNKCPYQLVCPNYNSPICPEEVVNCRTWKSYGNFDENELMTSYGDSGLVHILNSQNNTNVTT